MKEWHVVIAQYSDGSGDPVALVACDSLATARGYAEMVELATPMMKITILTPKLVVIANQPKE